MDYKLFILRLNGVIDTFDYTSPVLLKRAFSDSVGQLTRGEVVRAMAFGKVIAEHDSERS